MTNVGDLGRRVAERRMALGLSEHEVAERASMHPAYLEMLEHSPSPQLTRSALWRLSAALETTVEALCGAGYLSPPGQRDPQGRPMLDTLGHDECRELISQGGIGRLVFSEDNRPLAVPVNFKMLGDDIIFRTTSSSSLDKAMGNDVVSFEVDRIDEALGEGWSVLVSGEAHAISEPTERSQAEELHVTPWAGGARDVYVRIAPLEITGRRIRHV